MGPLTAGRSACPRSDDRLVTGARYRMVIEQACLVLLLAIRRLKPRRSVGLALLPARYFDSASVAGGERVVASITHYIEQRLKLRVNREKSVVARALRRSFLGFCLLPRMGEVRVLVDPKALKRAKDRLRALTSRRWGVSMERRIKEINRFTVGWTAYYRLADTRPRSRTSMNGSDADCGKCDGRSGSVLAHGGATCERGISR